MSSASLGLVVMWMGAGINSLNIFGGATASVQFYNEFDGFHLLYVLRGKRLGDLRAIACGTPTLLLFESASLSPCRIRSKSASRSCGTKSRRSARRTACTCMAAKRSYPAQQGITNVGFKDCRRFWTSWWRSPTGDGYDHVHPCCHRTFLRLRFAGTMETCRQQTQHH